MGFRDVEHHLPDLWRGILLVGNDVAIKQVIDHAIPAGVQLQRNHLKVG
jgi:hypothetical protein